MKYWRGYIVAALFAALTVTMMVFAQTHSALIEMLYPYVTRLIQTSLAQWTSAVSFCLWQFLAVALAAGLLGSVVLMLVFKWNPFQWLGWVLAVASVLFCMHTGIYGLNTHAGPLSDDIKLVTGEQTGLTVADRVEAVIYFRDIANELATQVPRNANGSPEYPSFDQLAAQAGEGFEKLVYEKYHAVFAGSTLPVKELSWADMYTAMGITGVTMPLTGEAAVNPQTPVMAMPFVMCHEMAHRMCIAQERDANLAAFLACDANSDVIFRYAGYFMAFRYCYNSLVAVGTAASRNAAEEIYRGIDVEFLTDITAYDDFFSANRNQTATNIADSANDTYIKVSGDESGTASYGQVGDLLVSWYLQEIYMPAHQDEAIKFDPTQADLSEPGKEG